jgi:hypothetical protein
VTKPRSLGFYVIPSFFTDHSGLSVWGITYRNKDKIIENDSKKDVLEEGVIIHLFIRVFTVKDIVYQKRGPKRYVLRQN